MSHLDVVQQPPDQMAAEVVLALYFEDQRPLVGPVALLDWRLDGQLTRLLLDHKLCGRAGEQLMLQNNGKLASDWVLLIGGGRWQRLDDASYLQLVRQALASAHLAGFREAGLCLVPLESQNEERLTAAVRQMLERFPGLPAACRLSCAA